MKKIFYNKLIRDKIPEVITQNGGKYQTRILTTEDFETELRKKLIEESTELINTPKKDLVDELSDVLEIIKTLASHYKIKFKTIEKHQQNKRKERGGFKKKLFLIWSSYS